MLADQKTPLVSTMPTSKSAAELLHKENGDTQAVKHLETYAGDVDDVMHRQHVSAVTIAAAETQRRIRTHEVPEPPPRSVSTLLLMCAYVLGGIALLIGTGTAMYYVISTQSEVVIPASIGGQLITVDHVTDITIPSGNGSKEVIALLEKTISTSNPLSGKVEQLRLTRTVEREEVALTATEFAGIALPRIPSLLLRSLNDNLVFGVFMSEGRSPFIAMSVDSYEQGFAGMLAWEPTLADDLSPYFPQAVPARLEAVVASSTTPTPTTTPSTPVTPTATTPTFTDEVIENRDTRVVRDASGNIILFWLFLDRNTLVIAKSASTLREVIVRLAQRPVVTK